MFKKKIRWLVHPVFVLVLAQIAWGLLMFIWIRWYILRSQEINSLIQKIPLPTTTSGQWVILAQGCILMAFILVGLYMIFVNQRRSSRLAKMQDAILSSVTHELKTPLASIRLYAETLLLRQVSEAERHKFLTRTLSEAGRLQRLIDTLLISARLQYQTGEIHFSRLNIKDILTSCLHTAKERFSEVRHFELILPNSSSDQTFFVLGNYNHLCILFDNLIDNAVKYTEAGGHIKIQLEAKKDLLSVAIEDNGVGIEKRNLKKIFKKFYRIEHQTQYYTRGSGLGLSLCQSIVKEHHGSIFAESAGLSKGSTFYVQLKRALTAC